jgi:hypothetical protein
MVESSTTYLAIDFQLKILTRGRESRPSAGQTRVKPADPKGGFAQPRLHSKALSEQL